MSDTIQAAVAALNEKMAGDGFDGTAKFVMGDEGSFIVDDTGAHAGEAEADVTLTADVDTFQQIFEGELNPTAAFMSGQLTIDGDMGKAMQLAQVLA
ncbi:SCP2 sterol-binding domain-containing protein [Cognatishimia sp. F0-27]|uniref:SCP2 sterol-binding domain-containing protein n=1 Tax=Cognatishimia sp. F0-27 TaxID=2816855 RepID=UPI001D0C96B3|nr:SCP2 sterol-binding domain-containing protein [Cognatishimia sp. F0-27]MCC1494085.1 SCP2 sterol-binding domain-containing protein [Cognatishimia sp. F0-27]